MELIGSIIRQSIDNSTGEQSWNSGPRTWKGNVS
ncbi:hypothetical protein NC652_013246 [Populus alba x Populus x berolinensis]|nr:hypothetical protein NC652_013246 [Populus alba x Populus x berolinensis]